MNNIYHKIITGGFALVLAGAVAFTAAPMDAQASAALGISSQIGLSADMDAAETTDVENAMNQTVLDAFHLDGYSNLGIVTVSEGKVNIRDSASCGHRSSSSPVADDWKNVVRSMPAHLPPDRSLPAAHRNPVPETG